MPRRTVWVDNLLNIGAGTGAENRVSLLTGMAPADTRGTTIVRMVYDFNLMSQTTAGAWGIQLVDIGVGIASQEAFTAAVLPDPNADERPVRGWMFRTRCVVSQNGVGTRILFPCIGDLRSSRKLDDGELYFTFHNAALFGSSFTVQIVGIWRVLLMLP